MIIALRIGETEFSATQYGFPLFNFRKTNCLIRVRILYFDYRTWSNPKFIGYAKNRWVKFCGVRTSIFCVEHAGQLQNIWIYELGKFQPQEIS